MIRPAEVPVLPAWLQERPWHTLGRSEALAASESGHDGLSEAEAARRLAIAGENLLPQKPPAPLWRIVLRQFKSPLVYVLAASAAVSLMLGHFGDAGFIGFVLAVNASIGSFQEKKADTGSRALQKLLRVRANVLRDGRRIGLGAETVVPGDILWIESGERVPADIRLLEATGIEIDESLLTGESTAVAKDPAWTGPASAPVAERLDMAYAGSVARRGRARGVAVATGLRTEIGKLAHSLSSAPDTPPPLIVRMEKFGTWLTIIIGVVCVLAAGAGIFLGHRAPLDMFFFAVALAVSAIPEGLPAALAVALSVAVSRMSRRGVIVRRLPAVEGLGSCTLIASDKTGTLTCNELTVKEIVLPDGVSLTVGGEGYAPAGKVARDGAPLAPRDPLLADLALAAVLCNEGDLQSEGQGWRWRGDSTDIALLSMARKMGWAPEDLARSHPVAAAIPFESERRFAAAYSEGPEGRRVYVKGAPERILSMCRDAAPAHAAVMEAMTARGLRVLAFASGPAGPLPGKGGAPEPPSASLPEASPSGLTFLGFTGMIDPLRPGVRQAVADCALAGVEVRMVTGDHPLTALAIARDLGLAERRDQVVTGADLEGMDAKAWPEAVRTARVFARVSPDQKLKIVQAAAALGHFVAVTGDGVNDAPALKAAHIGVAMGKDGTDVARDAAELVLADDNFATVVAGIEEGRIAYKNIRNVVAMQVATAMAEVVICTLAVLMGDPLPLLPLQLLWLNLVTNGIQDVALAFEPGEGDELRAKPRPPSQPLFNRLMVERVLVAGGAMSILGLVLFVTTHHRGQDEAAARNMLLLFMVLFENLGIGNYQSETKSIFRTAPWRNPLLLGGTALATLAHVAALYLPPLRHLLGTAPLDAMIWMRLLGMAALGIAVMEAHKAWVRRHPERYAL
jgi:Ca2+-transporting ATPase